MKSAQRIARPASNSHQQPQHEHDDRRPGDQGPATDRRPQHRTQVVLAFGVARAADSGRAPLRTARLKAASQTRIPTTTPSAYMASAVSG